MDQPDDSQWMGEVLSKENQHLRFWHDVIVHRYDYEVGRMNNLKYQATFILGAVGAIVTILISLCTSDHFPHYLNPIIPIILILAATTLIPLLEASYLAFKAFRQVHSWGYCLAYPNNKHIAISCSPDNLNLDLINIIQRNANNNDKTALILKKAQEHFEIGLKIFIIIPLILIIILIIHPIIIFIINFITGFITGLMS